MDLIYTNSKMVDIGVLLEYDFDLAFGTDENDFQCSVNKNSHCCSAGNYLYIEGTEYGGVIDSIESKSETSEVIYIGRTWHGILNSKVLQPDAGADYLVLNGEANTVIGTLLKRIGLDSLFETSEETTMFNLHSYKMDRYISAYDGIRKMLSSVGAKPSFTFKGGKVVISALAKHDYSTDEQFDSDLVVFDMLKGFKTTNHMICLGKGDLAARMVVHLYADIHGNISRTQTQFGLDEVAEVYDYNGVESEDELIEKGTERLVERWQTDELNIDFDDNSNSYDVGDILGSYDNITGISVAAEITKKIISISNGKTNISYKVGEK